MSVRKPTIRTVAADAGVSVSAVSKVLRNAYGVSDSLRNRVEVSIEKLGYRPNTAARGMRGQSYAIGVLLVEFSNPFLPTVVDGIGKTLGASQYKPFLGVGRRREEIEGPTIETMIDMSMDGLILVAPSLSRERITHYSRQIPLVAIGHHDAEATSFDTVNSDDHAGGRLATQALVDSGYRRIEMLTLPRDATKPHNVQSRRESGYLDIMKAAGLPASIIRMKSATGPSEQDLIAYLDRPELPEAVFCWSDLHAIPLINIARMQGLRVPEDLAIVGYDNSPVAEMPLISLSSVDQDGSGLGALAAETILSRLEGRTEARHDVISPKLINRVSS
ncbi:LacI family DNA-binding transcriptional regulator [Granulosicoccus sp. 3-233]|uniref:LacI family DNA-binding transcriptional regulator n=1 Tax=Granulosicoccus sp. 3-233 TaxID=3417969 RepID=UPI003D338F44